MRDAPQQLMNVTYKFIAGLLLVGAVAIGGYYAWNHNSGSGLGNLSADSKLSDSQVAQVVARISQFLVVPVGEDPTATVIKDVAQLAAQQSFYQGAQDGDILVLYTSRAIIYDPKADKLVNVGPIIRSPSPSPSEVASGSQDITPSPSVSPAATPKTITVDVRNGTSVAGLAGATASTLKKNKLFTIGAVGDAGGTYTQTVVVDLTKGKDDGKSASIALLAKQLDAKVVTALPKGETTSTADAVVIVGK